VESDLERKNERLNRIPIRFADAPHDEEPGAEGHQLTDEGAELAGEDEEAAHFLSDDDVTDLKDLEEELARQHSDDDPAEEQASGPVVAELVATRAELKRVQAEAGDLRDKVTRRQADFENLRKRTERERSDTYNRVAGEVAAKLLPVLDNLGRALDAEASVEANESDEFRHFLSGVDLIYKQLTGVLETLGVKPVPAVGESFDPHMHEAVVTEETEDFEPDTVMQEIVRGYRLGDKLLRPALVKVAVRK